MVIRFLPIYFFITMFSDTLHYSGNLCTGKHRAKESSFLFLSLSAIPGFMWHVRNRIIQSRSLPWRNLVIYYLLPGTFKTEWKLFYNKVNIWRHISKIQEKLWVIFKYLKSSPCSILIFITHTEDPIPYFCSVSLAIALGKRQ